MRNSPILAVRGEVALEVEPEVARIEASIAARGADRAATLLTLTERDAEVSLILGDFADIIEKSESSGVRLGPQQSSKAGGSVCLGVIHHTITVVCFERLGELMAILAAEELTEVGGPWWDLRLGSPVYRQVRIAAVSDAVRRARDYAAAVGSELADLVELADAHMLSESRSSAEARPLASPSARLPHRPRVVAAEEPVFDLSPARQVVRAVVEARFTLTEPDLAAVPA
jgi:uncharacterized protein YggE